MCGRFTLISDAKKISRQFNVKVEESIEPNYNIFPSSHIALIRAEDKKRQLASVRWGLVPSWQEDNKKGQINARCETVHEKPFFRSSFKKRRGIVIADGWYEWQNEAGKKQPYYFRRKDNALLAIAAIWSSWGEKENYFESCALLTCASRGSVKHIHSRMPLLLNDDKFDLWLSNVPFSSITEKTASSFPVNKLVQFPVSPTVNNPGNNQASCIEPL